jgi:hypothetical protein
VAAAAAAAATDDPSDDSDGSVADDSDDEAATAAAAAAAAAAKKRDMASEMSLDDVDSVGVAGAAVMRAIDVLVSQRDSAYKQSTAAAALARAATTAAAQKTRLSDTRVEALTEQTTELSGKILSLQMDARKNRQSTAMIESLRESTRKAADAAAAEVSVKCSKRFLHVRRLPF